VSSPANVRFPVMEAVHFRMRDVHSTRRNSLVNGLWGDQRPQWLIIARCGSFRLLLICARRLSLPVWWWTQDFVRFLQELAHGGPINRRREGRVCGERVVEFNQLFEFSHIAAKVSDIAPKVIKTFSYFGKEIRT